MNKNVVLAGKIAGIALGYFLVFFLAVFSTVSLLVKGDEVSGSGSFRENPSRKRTPSPPKKGSI